MRTTTAVHDEQTHRAQREMARAQGGEASLGLALTAQLLAYGALYTLPAASTAAWIAALLQLLPLAAMRGLGLWVRRTAPPGADRLPLRRAAGIGFSLLFLLNMAMCLLTLTELAHVFFFPRAERLTLALAAALALGLGMPRDPDAVANTVRLARWFLLAAFVFCAVTVLPAGESGYLYPLAGHGALPTLRCAALSAGAVWMAGIPPVLNAGSPSPVARPLPIVRSVLWVTLLFLCCAYVLPGTALNFGRGYALRLQLLMEMSPNTLSWSLMLIAQMLLFLCGYAVCADLMRKTLKSALRVKNVPLLPFALLCAPLAARGMGAWEDLLRVLLPLRYPAAALCMALCLIANLIAKKGGGSPEKAADLADAGPDAGRLRPARRAGADGRVPGRGRR